MNVTVREYMSADAMAAMKIWNEVVEEGNAFPQLKGLTEDNADAFFKHQSYTGIAVDADGRIVGLSILHPNNVGRCSHIANASYAIAADERGNHIGETLVQDCLKQGKRLGFRILQFNAVVVTNAAAIHLYEKLGFEKLGTIPGGFHAKDDSYRDINLYYHTL